MNRDKIVGSVLALAMGDALGAVYEGGIVERAVWHVLGKRRGRWRWTDDTQMSIDIIESFIASGGVDQDDLARRFARSYKWSRGYGPGAAKILKRMKEGVPWEKASRSVYKDGSFGNGAAMRAAPVGLFHAQDTDEKITKAAIMTAQITHAHPDGMEGAVLIAWATALALKEEDSDQILCRLCDLAKSPVFSGKLRKSREWLQDDKPVSPSLAESELGNGIAAIESCVTAIYCALVHRNSPFEALLAYVRALGGDVDTIGAMSSAIWGASRGANALPEHLLKRIEEHEYLERLAESFFEHVRLRGGAGDGP